MPHEKNTHVEPEAPTKGRETKRAGSSRATSHRDTHSLWRVGRFWINTLIALVALGVSIAALDKAVTVTIRLDDLMGEEGKALLITEMDRIERLLARVDGAIADSVRAGISRASARGFGRGSIAAYEVRRGLEPLEDSVEDQWFAMDHRILQLLARMGFGVVSILEVETLSDFHPRYSHLKTQKDSVLARIRERMEQ